MFNLRREDFLGTREWPALFDDLDAHIRALRGLLGLPPRDEPVPEPESEAAARAPTPAPGLAQPFGLDASPPPPMAMAIFDIGPRAGGAGGNGLFGSPAGSVVVFLDADLTASLFVDLTNRTILAESPEGARLGDGDHDLLFLSGIFAGPVRLPPGLSGLESIVLGPGGRYDLAVGDDQLAAGAKLLVNGMALGAQDSLRFDGSAERDGRFDLFGGEGDDILIGGAGADRLAGMGGGDLLIGGPGADIFYYEQAGHSTGAAHDVLLDFDPAEDRIDLPFAVSGFAAAVAAGGLSTATFDDDLAAALAGLGAYQAVLFRPDEGELAGTVFLIVDGNGVEGYQPGEDYVFALPNFDLPDLTLDIGIFV